MPTIEDLAAVLCQLRDLGRLEYVKCLEDGTICIPNEIPCCSEKSINLSQSDLLSLAASGSNDALLQEIIDLLSDDIEVGNYTVLCSAADPSVTYLAWFEQPDEVGSAIVPYHMVLGTNTPVPGFPADGVKCPDTKVIQECFYTPGDPDVYFTRVLCLVGTQVIESIWIDASGAVMAAAPSPVQPCEGEEHRTTKQVKICGVNADGTCETGILESVYNQNGTLFSQQTLDAELNAVSYASYTVGACVLATRHPVPIYACPGGEFSGFLVLMLDKAGNAIPSGSTAYPVGDSGFVGNGSGFITTYFTDIYGNPIAQANEPSADDFSTDPNCGKNLPPRYLCFTDADGNTTPGYSICEYVDGGGGSTQCTPDAILDGGTGPGDGSYYGIGDPGSGIAGVTNFLKFTPANDTLLAAMYAQAATYPQMAVSIDGNPVRFMASDLIPPTDPTNTTGVWLLRPTGPDPCGWRVYPAAEINSTATILYTANNGGIATPGDGDALECEYFDLDGNELDPDAYISIDSNCDKFDFERLGIRCIKNLDGLVLAQVDVTYVYDIESADTEPFATSYLNLSDNTQFTYDPLTMRIGECDGRGEISTCFVPDQYAYQWSWNGTNGALQRFDPLTNTWIDYCDLLDPRDGSPLIGFALAFQNDLVDPRLWFQDRDGDVFYASPSDPCNTVTYVGNSGLTAMPCFDFDPSGRLLVGNGVSVWEIDQNTGAATLLGDLIDARDNQTLSASPGDWMFGPDGSWYMMARDNAGATYGECTGTVLWKIDPATLVTTRISDTCAPTSGTGATWLAGGQYLLSTSGGQLYQYNEYADDWTLLTTAPNAINDLAAEWVIPDPISVTGYVEWDANGCNVTLYTFSQDPITLELLCQEFVPSLPGKFDPTCTTQGNPFVSDPLDPDSGGGSGCDTCPDKVWHQGCSDAGVTLYRDYSDSAGNDLTEYVYGTLGSPVAAAPPNFVRLRCEDVPIYPISLDPFCNLDTGKTVYRETENDVVQWLDETGYIAEPPNKEPGECPNEDDEVVSNDDVICFNGVPYIRREVKQFVENPATGVLEVDTITVSYFNGDGQLWATGDTDPEPSGWFIGTCPDPYVSIDRERLCEIPDKKLLMIDSGGSFTEISDYDGSTANISIPVPSAGAGADIDNYILYAVTQSDELLAIDVNTRTTLYQIPLFTNDGSVLGTAAASFNQQTGELWYYDYGTDEIYAVNVTTGEVSYVAGPFTGIAGSGSSMAINPVDGRVYVSGSGGRIYEVDPSGATTAATLVYDSVSEANGLTFGSDGELYFGSTSGNASNYGEVYVVRDFPNGPTETYYEDWAPGVNSLAYYEIEPNQPSCFNRIFGVLPDGSREYIEDRYVADDSPRLIVGAVDCCECSCAGGDSGGGTGGNVTVDGGEISVDNFPEPKTCQPGYAVITGGSTWTPPAGTVSVSAVAVRGNNSSFTTPNGSGTFWRGTGHEWQSSDFGELGFAGFSITGGGGTHRVQISFTVCN